MLYLPDWGCNNIHPSFLLSKQKSLQSFQVVLTILPTVPRASVSLKVFQNQYLDLLPYSWLGFSLLSFFDMQACQSAAFLIATLWYLLSGLPTNISKSVLQTLLLGLASLAFFLSTCALVFYSLYSMEDLKCNSISFQFVRSHLHQQPVAHTGFHFHNFGRTRVLYIQYLLRAVTYRYICLSFFVHLDLS